jgi:muramoyltetrapeptide carboxypeptidase
MIIPPYLQKGDTIAVVAPARFIEPKEIKSFEAWAKKCGWRVISAPNAFGKHHQFSGTIEERVNDIKWALENEEVKAVFSARGGYGCTQLLEHIQAFDFLSSPKWWVGFSDITTLHLTFQNQGLASIHGPMVMQFNLSNPHHELNQRHLFNALSGISNHFGLRNYDSVNLASFEGQIVGGNLSLLFAHSGVAKQNFGGKVLFIEDLDEYLYHIDRMICSLKLGGTFTGLKALIVGSMIDMRDNTIPFGKNVKEIILEHLENEGFPIIFDFPAGHDQQNIALKLGMNCTFDGHTFSQI